MGSNGCEESMISGSNQAICSEATVEIKIKTLDSQTYTLRVDKCVPVPALKEQIATVTGILSEQQRLICRGKVLKDDQLLSAYHVEDGHTLHLVVRQPITPSSESFSEHPATDPLSSTDHGQGNQVGPSVLVGTFNISEQVDGALPDLGRIVSAVLGSFGITDVGSGGEGIDLQAPGLERLSRTTGPAGFRNYSRQQPNQVATRSGFPYPASFSLDSLQPPTIRLSSSYSKNYFYVQEYQVIPDSLTTLSQYLSHMRQELSANAGDQSNPSQDVVAQGSDGQNPDAVSGSAARHGGLPTPASLAEVMLSTRQFLNEQAGECLLQLTRQVEEHASVTDPVARMRIQSNAMRIGTLLQNLGALLLELGRTTMTLRVGQTPADAVVNAGPAVFISTSGPNPIMVQPLPFQPGASFGSIPEGTVQPGPGLSSGSVGSSGFLPRNIDIRIRTGSVMHSSVANPREPSVGQPIGQNNPATPGSENYAQPVTVGAAGSSPSIRSEVRVVPLRTVVTAVPASGGSATSNSSLGSMGLFYPILARVQPANPGNLDSTRGHASDEPPPHGVDTAQQSIPNAASQEQNIEVPRADEFLGRLDHNRLDELFTSFLASEHIHETNFYGMGSTMSASGNVEVVHAANSQEAEPRAGDEGTFLSNLLREIMPLISQNTTETNNTPVEGGYVIEDRTTEVSSEQAQENSDRVTSLRRRSDDPSPESSKRQKRE